MPAATAAVAAADADADADAPPPNRITMAAMAVRQRPAGRAGRPRNGDRTAVATLAR